MALVDVVADERCTAVFPAQFPAVLRVRLRDGSEIEEAVMTNRGGPDRPLTYDELATKFTDNASRVLDPGTVETLRDRIARLDEIDDVGALLRPLRSVPGPRLSGS
jgi:2-methylcitrate dehydratase PrpD